MGKVSIGLRGWRFDESAVFDEAGRFRPLEEMPDDDRERLLRLTALVGAPCDACWLVHGDDGLDECRPAAAVYGEPGAEVVLCRSHETDFDYWYHEDGGRELRGTAGFQSAFHEWFDDGGRAPEGYAGIEHVDTDPESLPEPPAAADVDREAPGERIDLRAFDPDVDYPT